MPLQLQQQLGCKSLGGGKIAHRQLQQQGKREPLAID